MLTSAGTLMYALGAAFLLSPLGAAELLLSVLVAAGLVGCAVRGRERPGEDERGGETPHRHA